MRDDRRIRDCLDTWRPGHTLPQEFYTDPEFYAFDLEAIFGESWLMIGFEAELPKPGSYLALTIGRTPIFVVRDRAGTIRGFFNACRHRGAQICPDGHGKATRLSCPYHQWTYELDGSLMRARLMGPDFDPSEYSLVPIHVETVAGTIYVCLSETPPDFSAYRADLEPMLAPFRLQDAKVVHEVTLVEKANWKLVMENGRECYHCAACHPELGVSFPVGITPKFAQEEGERQQAYCERMIAHGLEVGPRDGPWWQCARFPLNDGMISMSRDGKPVVAKPLLDVDGGDTGSFRFATEPHNFTHVLGDYAFSFSAYPVGPEETHVVGKWLVRGDAVEGIDYDLTRLVETWDVTNRQDRDLAELNQRGVNGRGYRPGPYSDEAEAFVLRFIDWYVSRVRSRVGGPTLRVAEVA